MGRFINYLDLKKKIYVFKQILKNFGSADLQKLIFGFYSQSQNESTIVLEHFGEKYSDKIIYNCEYGIDYFDTTGFFSMFLQQLELLLYADRLGFVPVINWGEKHTYYDKEMDMKTTNVFEYYFKPVSCVPYSEVYLCANVIKARKNHAGFFIQHSIGSGNSYKIENKEIQCMAHIYQKYIRLNDEIHEHINREITRILINKKTLGVHVRGTDYKQGANMHPIIASPQEYISIIKENSYLKEFDQIFLATDDLNILNIFKEEFGNKMIYYNDVFRGGEDQTVLMIDSNRPLHRYKLGFEVIRDVYTLAHCDALIAGLSQVSFAARIINEALGRRFEKISIINNGLVNTVNKKAVSNLNKISKSGTKYNRRDTKI